jgi:uncharacterized protein YkwD
MRLVSIALLALALHSTPALACTQPPGAAGLRAAVLDLVNSERAGRGLAPLRMAPALQQAAQSHACDSAGRNRMGHDGSDGSTLANRAKREGYRYRELAENVAQGYPNASAVMQGWMGSPGHRRNILSSGLREAGLGIAVGGNGDLHWVLNLGRAR